MPEKKKLSSYSKEYKRQWYQKNKEKCRRQHNKRKANRRKELKEWVTNYKYDHCCIKCGETHPACLIFHHREREEKCYDVAAMIRDGLTLKRVKAEIAKCDLICANCHHKLHWEGKYDPYKRHRLNPSGEFHEKGWGYEYWIVNNEKYCGKLLFFNQSKSCSWHYHRVKEETFYCQSGQLKVWHGHGDDFDEAEVTVLSAGDGFHVPIGLRHKMLGLTDVELFEFSTQHFDEDSYRIIKGD